VTSLAKGFAVRMNGRTGRLNVGAKISVSTVRRAIKAGELSATRIGTLGQLRISTAALKAFVDKGASGYPTPEARMLSLAENVSTYGEDDRSASGRQGQDPVPAGTVERSRAAVRKADGRTPDGLQWSVLTGDVRDALEQIATGTVSCVVTSPPYYWQRDYEVAGQLGHEPSIEGFVNNLRDVFRSVQRVLDDRGTVFLNLGDTYYSAKGKPHGRDDKHHGRQMMRRHLRAVDGPGLGLPRKSLIGIPWRVALAMQADGWTLRSTVVWQRPGSMPEPTAHDRPWRTHENIFIFSKGPHYHFNRKGLRGEEDVWQMIARPENPGAHFAPYPKELVDRCLDVGCKPGGTVLDPFVGSGTTMLSALSRGCPAIGIDLKPEYCDYVVKRIRTEFSSPQLRLASAHGRR
jgi:excisionase family DNA binding protein